MISFDTSIIDIIQRTPGVKSFRFEAKEEVAFKPGQFFFVTIKIGEKDRTKHFSFSNSPTEKGYVEFTKRITESDFSKALDALKTGDWARLKMPFGSFTFEGEYEKIVFLSGGIGITPIRSICKFVLDAGLQTHIVLLYSNKDENGIIFRSDFGEMQDKNKNFRAVYTLTSPYADKKTWNGRTGYINQAMIQEEVPDYKDRIFYVCGPPSMVSSLTEVLKDKLKVEEAKIKVENFVGY
ncbi:MAG: FAD-dependent oxidoreductase [Candidatus Omnitrophota bacterium]